MFRKSLVSVLILLYSASVIGVPLHFHYCRGELKHVSVLVKMECHVPAEGTSDHTCCQTQPSHCSSAHTLNNCCDDATQWIQDNLPAICYKSDLDNSTNESEMEIVLAHQLNKTTHVIKVPSPDVKGDNANEPLYLLQCALIFYG